MAKLVKSIYTGSDVTALGEVTTSDSIEHSVAGTITTDNDLSFDMSTTNNFKCTPSSTGTTYISAADLAKINSAGVYFLSYYSDGTNVMVSASSAVTSAGA
jgi:hypothetical protein